jgi:hypothetical protein
MSGQIIYNGQIPQIHEYSVFAVIIVYECYDIIYSLQGHGR